MDTVKTFTVPSEVEELSPKEIESFIRKHHETCTFYKKMEDFYRGRHSIFAKRRKPFSKPDNRLVANFAKYIVDTFNGYFVGKPVRIHSESETAAAYLKVFEKANSLDDQVSELSKKCDIYGHAFELLYMDENAEVCVTEISPMECILIRDDTIRRRKKFCIRYFENAERVLQGTVSDSFTIKYFKEGGRGLAFTDEVPHPFGEVPVVEYVENEERQGAFENVTTLINAYNKALSEKANDVDYFADSYMKILGAILDQETIENLRDNRIINMASPEGREVVVDFMEKPNADQSQENLLNRLERLIFTVSMVADINDEKFGTASGIALQYKLQSMSNLAMVKERKFQKGFDERFRMIARVPTSGILEKDLPGIYYVFSRNIPKNVQDEAQTARSLQGIVSDETLLGSLSIVPDVKSEMEKIKAEEESYPRIDYGGGDLE